MCDCRWFLLPKRQRMYERALYAARQYDMRRDSLQPLADVSQRQMLQCQRTCMRQYMLRRRSDVRQRDMRGKWVGGVRHAGLWPRSAMRCAGDLLRCRSNTVW